MRQFGADRMPGEQKEAVLERAPRRRFLALGAGAAAAALATALTRASRASGSSGDPLIVGEQNTVSDERVTGLTGDVGPRSVVLQVANTFDTTSGGGSSSIVGDGPNGATGVRGMSTRGPGVHATSETGTGVIGECGSPRFSPGDPGFSLGSGIGVLGRSGSGPGVKGESGSGVGVNGSSDSGRGVFGRSGSAAGVSGESGSGIGVSGVSQTGHGVMGRSLGDDHAGVFAISGTGGVHDKGLALKVVGKAGFSTAGSSTVRAHSRDVAVTNTAVTPNSHITVTFTADPNEVQLSWVERRAGIGFVVHLTNKPHSDLPFTYLVVEPQ